ncbi:Adenylate kinase 9 [Clonorchis sinensis]|uniref:Adenylate kinase 9 n=1 Tax=Clonorchis sinensis TaxID=79923 RepID=A0A419PVA5_CLOSI|nr:Adenylate kinase 9 [Clonorchis sinensis]
MESSVLILQRTDTPSVIVLNLHIIFASMSSTHCCRRKLQSDKEVFGSPPEVNNILKLSGTTDSDSFVSNSANMGDQNVPRFVIFGKPSTGKSRLAQRLCQVWNCEHVNASELISRNIREHTQIGNELVDIMTDGKDLEDKIVIKLISEKLQSPECHLKGFILDDFPTNSEQVLSIAEQLNMLSELRPEINCYVYIHVPDEEHRSCWSQKRIDPETGLLYTPVPCDGDDGFLPTPYTPQFQSGFQPASDQSFQERLITRHEELPECLDQHFSFNSQVMRPLLDRFLSNQTNVPCLRILTQSDGSDLFVNTVRALYNISDHPRLRALDLFGELEVSGLNTAEPTTDVTMKTKLSRWQKIKDKLRCHSERTTA